MTALERVYTPKTAEIVASRIRGQILRGQLGEGSALPSEAVLVEQLGVSRPTLREAFRLLESEGLIVIRRGAHGGARVVPPTTTAAARHAGLVLQYRGATIEDIFNTRAIIEPPAAGLVAKRRDPELVRRLQHALDVEQAAIDDSLSFSVNSTNFHELIVALSGSPTLALFASILADMIRKNTERVVMSRASDPAQPADARRAHRAHVRVVELIEAGDAEGAELLWERHAAATTPFLLRTMPKQSIVDLFE